jgi:hypothetical protein
MKGIFDLVTPADLLAKLRSDFDRLKRDPSDSYAAFDFFVTARHLPEWLYPDDEPRQRAVFDDEVLMRVCAHIADGSKHFEAKSKRHFSVKSTSLEGAWAQKGLFQPDMIDNGELVVELDVNAAESLGDKMDALTLATRVLDFWDAHPDVR